MTNIKVGVWSGRALVLMAIAAGCGDNHIPGLVPDSARGDAAVRDSAVGDGPINDGPFNDGPINDGPLADGPVSDGPINDGPLADGPVSDGPLGDGPLSDGAVVDGGLDGAIDGGLVDGAIDGGLALDGGLDAMQGDAALDAGLADASLDAGLDAMLDASPDASGACVQQPVALGFASTFGVLASTTVTNTGPTFVNGDLGVWPGTAVTGFGPGVVTGTQYAGTTPAMIAQGSLTIAYNDAAGRPPACATLVAGNLGGQTLPAGLYKSTDSIAVTSGNLTLDGGGDPNAVFIFQVATTLTTASGLQVQLINGAQAKNVFYQIGSSASLGSGSVVRGTILAHVAISLATGARLDGRALAATAGVTLDTNVVTVP